MKRHRPNALDEGAGRATRLEHELHTAHTILDVQGKVAGLLGLNLKHGTRS